MNPHLRSILAPYTHAAALSLGLVLGGTVTWLVSSPPDVAGMTCRSADLSSRAHYIAATQQLSPAWGEWNIAIYDRNDAIRTYKLLIGIDTEKRCKAAAERIEKHGAEAMCFGSVNFGRGETP